ncbi:MAG: hypothetical protein AB3N28_16320 [Kordiimonas sp.]
MKYTLIISAILFFAVPGTTDDTASYNDMTYDQLKLVKPNTLSKADKKAWKKAYKKAEKAHKNEVRKRKKAVVKRKKAERKAAKKRRKLLTKRLKDFEKSYSKTRILSDEYEPSIRVVGHNNSWQANSSLKFLLSTPPATEYFMRAFFRPDTEALTLQIYITKHISKKIPVSPDGDPLVSPMQHATYERWWGNYHKAALPGGFERKIIPIRKSAKQSSDTSPYFNFYEEFAIYLNEQDLLQSISDSQDLSIKISSRSRQSVILTLTPDYIAGFLKKLSEVDSRLAYLSESANTFITQANRELGE